MSDIVTLIGVVATPPRHLVTGSGLAITSFRLASGQRRFDRAQNTWVDADTNWYTVSTFRHLAYNVANSVHKGEHVLITGRLRVRRWENADRKGISIDVDADSVGHDLTWGTTTYVRNAPRAQSPEATPPENLDAAPAPYPDLQAQDPYAQDPEADELGVGGPGAGGRSDDGFLADEPSDLVSTLS